MNAADAVTALPREVIEPEKKPQAQRLVELIPGEALFRSTDGETAYATIPVDGHRETWPIRSKGVRRWLVGCFYVTEGKPPSGQALTDALGTLEARAQFGGHIHEVHVRVAGHSGAVYLDLVNAAWDIVEVTAAGWRLERDPPVKFRRSRGMQALPHPVHGGSLSELRPFVNVRDDAQWALLVAWLIGTLKPQGPIPSWASAASTGAARRR